MATAAGKLFSKHGALTYREYVASDLNVEGGIMAFDKDMRQHFVMISNIQTRR